VCGSSKVSASADDGKVEDELNRADEDEVSLYPLDPELAPELPLPDQSTLDTTMIFGLTDLLLPKDEPSSNDCCFHLWRGFLPDRSFSKLSELLAPSVDTLPASSRDRTRKDGVEEASKPGVTVPDDLRRLKANFNGMKLARMRPVYKECLFTGNQTNAPNMRRSWLMLDVGDSKGAQDERSKVDVDAVRW
jgi:hypothetical protein